MLNEKQILSLRADGYSQRKIAQLTTTSRNTIAKIFTAADSQKLFWDQAKFMNEHSIHKRLFPEEENLLTLTPPDFDYIHKELLKDGVTLKLLWDEYASQCRSIHKPFYKYSYFCEMYGEHVVKYKLTMHIIHKPGNEIMVDWDGTPMQLFDNNTGEQYKVYMFVATLPFSMFSFAYACLSMKEEDWINVHIKMYAYFGGVSRLLIPDNLKVGIISHGKHEEPVLNKTYREFADYYDTAVLPTRVRKPKDKAAVEGSVGQITSHIIAKLRNRTFYDLTSLNNAIRKELDEFNKTDFQKKDGSRYSVYIEEEKPFMHPLPACPYEYSQWKVATVQLNYHVSVDKMYYSIPYEYTKKKVDVKYSKSLIEVYYKGNRICSHKRLYGKQGQYSTSINHMPENHKAYSEWNGERFKKWSASIGTSCHKVVEQLLVLYKVEEQAYNGCLSLLKLSDKYSAERLENACQLALQHISIPRYKNIKLILEAGQDTKVEQDKMQENNDHAFIRGANYYGGNENE